jgi:predicted SprT family Zn-dependent metalloprotease
MQYQWFEQDIDAAWSYKLLTEYDTIQRIVHKATGHWLNIPNFKISPDMTTKWGNWNPQTRTITLSLNLLRNYEWAAVVHTLKHETAHQIVDELLDLNTRPHGEAFKLACTILGIDGERCHSDQVKSSFKGRFQASPTIEKIRKLIIHGNDHGISQEESSLFLGKAQELMIKYQVSLHQIYNEQSSTFYTVRPVGPLVDQHKSWLGQIAVMISKFYSVSCIWMYAPNGKRRIEFYGTPENLDIAEYVFHALITQAEYLWEQFKNEHQNQLSQDRLGKPVNHRPLNYQELFANCSTTELLEAQSFLLPALEKAINERKSSYGKWFTIPAKQRKISKKAFMTGLVTAYTLRLAKEKQVIFDTVTPNDKALIHNGEQLLKAAYQKHYKPRDLGSTSYVRGKGYSEGVKAGSTLTLAKGVTTSNNSVAMLT